MNAAGTDARGSIVFYPSYGNTWQDKLWTKVVSWGTKGPYVHCEMIYDQITVGSDLRWRTIGAHGNGISFGLLPTHAGKYTIVPLQVLSVDDNGNAAPIEETRLEHALRWAFAHLGMSYGMIDNFNQAVDLLWASCPLHLSAPDHFNCSNFVAAILDHAGIPLPRSFTYPFDVSPNDLAEWCGLLPTRNRVKK